MSALAALEEGPGVLGVAVWRQKDSKDHEEVVIDFRPLLAVQLQPDMPSMGFSTTSRRSRGVSPYGSGQMTLNEILRNHAFTRGLGDAQIAKLASMASEVTFEENDVILIHGERSQNFFLILTGSV